MTSPLSRAPASGSEQAGEPGPPRTRIKICGLTNEEDARLAARLGADFLGLVLAESPRRVRVQEARAWVAALKGGDRRAQLVGVFLRPSAAEVEDAVQALGLDLVQIHGRALKEAATARDGKAAPDEAAAAEARAPWGGAETPVPLAANDPLGGGLRHGDSPNRVHKGECVPDRVFRRPPWRRVPLAGLTFPYFRANRLRWFACANLSTRVLSVGW